MAKISARGRWELARVEKQESAIVFCSDGTVLYRRTCPGSYVVLPQSTDRLRGGKEWKRYDIETKRARVAAMVAQYVSKGYAEVPCHVTYGSHEQRNGA
jgi:hypothetical protein